MFRYSDNGNSDNHRTDDLRCRGFEYVCSPSGAVSDVVTDEVGDDRGVPGVVLRYPCFDLSHKVRAHIGGFGVYAASELGEQCRERGTERIAHDVVEGLGHFLVYGVVNEEYGEEAEDAQRRNDYTGNGSSAEGGLEGAGERLACGAGRFDVGADGYLHSDETGKDRESRSYEESDGHGVSQVVSCGLGDSRERYYDCHDYADYCYRFVLAPQICHGARFDRIGDLLHFRGSFVPRPYVGKEVQCKDQCNHDGNRNHEKHVFNCCYFDHEFTSEL